MAAYAALVSLMHVIDDIKHLHSPPISLDKHKQRVQSLTEIVTFMQEFLESYVSPIDDIDEMDPLQRRIADAAYAAEDVIESHIVNRILPASSQHRRNEINGFYNCLRILKNPTNVDSDDDIDDIDDEHIKLYQDLHRVIEEMDLIKKVAMEIDAKKAVVVHDERLRFVDAPDASLRSLSFKQNNIMVCSEDVLLEIMEKLVAGRPDRHVIPIVGMGGIGKTTLAESIYAHPLIKEHFDICAWATISQQYNTKGILCELLCQFTKKEKKELSGRSEDEVGTSLYKYLFGRRFLIVMDDMWSVDAWDEIQRYFPNNVNGSRVLVTTRLSQLSSQLNINYSHHMKFLGEVSSWNLFCKTVFGEKNFPRELMKIGKKIVDNCRGLPLSIVVVGGLLRKTKHTQSCWESIRKNLTSLVNLENDKHCLRLFKMSYSHLPVCLKPCFLYMGVFEEDDRIRVSTLIQLWVSEGFIKPMRGKSLETVAEEYLKDLIDRNLILIDRLGYTGNLMYCKIHDLLRDFCLNEGRKDGFYHVVGKFSPQGTNIRQRRVVIPRNTSTKKIIDELRMRSMAHARSVICEYGEVPSCQNFQLLRTLHAYSKRYLKHGNYFGSHALSSHALSCVNLRHLAIEVHSMSSLFDSLSLLWNLQTLIISCEQKSVIPAEIWKMPRVRHVEFVGRHSLCLPDPPAEVFIMENLRTLNGIENFKCSDEVVERIPNIRKLGMKCCKREVVERIPNNDHCCLSNIERLCKLESITISCECHFTLVASVQKLHYLKKLTMRMKAEFEWEDMLEKIGSLRFLEKLKLWQGCFGRGKWEMVDGQFPCLKFLGLYFCWGLKQWIVEDGSIFLPCLEQLQLLELKELEEIPCQIWEIATLQKIMLLHCTESLVKSAKAMVEEQVELQGEQLPFQVVVSLDAENKALLSLASPNFIIE